MEIIVNGIKYELRPEQGGAYVIENDYSGDVIIPSEVMVDGANVPVVGIAEDAFFSCTYLTSVQLPDGLKTIEEAAFESATALTEIVIPNSVISIGGLGITISVRAVADSNAASSMGFSPSGSCTLVR